MEIFGKRLADEKIYEGQNRTDDPKEVEKVLANILAAQERPPGTKVLDVGCAAGDFLRYLRNQFPKFAFTGVEVLKNLADLSIERSPGIPVRVGSILDSTFFKNESADVIFCNGVLQIFEDIETPINNLLQALRPGGTLFIHTPVNDTPVDWITRYRRAETFESTWELGWNIFSTLSFDRVLEASSLKLEWTWQAFQMPFPLGKKDDPMRSHTFKTEYNQFQEQVGGLLLINTKILIVHKPSEGTTKD